MISAKQSEIHGTSCNDAVTRRSTARILAGRSIDVFNLGDDAIASRAAAIVVVGGPRGGGDVFDGECSECVHL